MQWIRRRDANGIFGYIPLADAIDLPAVLADVDSVVLRDKDGKIFVRSKAVSRICYLLGWPWKAVYYISMFVPVGMADGMYDLVARNRHRWQKQGAACDLPQSNSNN